MNERRSQNEDNLRSKELRLCLNMIGWEKRERGIMEGRGNRWYDGAERNGKNHFRDNSPRKKPFRFSPAVLSVVSEPEGYLRAVSPEEKENRGSRLLVSFSFFGELTMEAITLQPVA